MRLNRMNAPNTGSGTVDVNAVVRSTVPDPRLGVDGRECELTTSDTNIPQKKGSSMTLFSSMEGEHQYTAIGWDV
jgi:hypothetical protein